MLSWPEKVFCQTERLKRISKQSCVCSHQWWTCWERRRRGLSRFIIYPPPFFPRLILLSPPMCCLMRQQLLCVVPSAAFAPMKPEQSPLIGVLHSVNFQREPSRDHRIHFRASNPTPPVHIKGVAAVLLHPSSYYKWADQSTELHLWLAAFCSVPLNASLPLMERAGSLCGTT